MQPYEIIKAKSQQEAIAQSKFKVGYFAQITKVEAVSNSDGTFSIFPVVEPLDSTFVVNKELVDASE